MKKIFCLLLVAMLAFTTACGATPTPSQSEDNTPTPGESTADVSTPTPVIDPTPTPEPPKEVIDVSYLADYTIVYPSAYTDYRMQEIYLLRDVIEHITGSAPNIAADTDEAVEKEIIIGSSNRTTDVSSDIAAFESGLDYLIARIDDKIVLGGNNFYADMRAIYDFINNYLGYDDIEDVYGDPTVKAEGVNIKLYKKPPIKILGANYAVSPFTEQFAIRDAAEAHFNMLLTTCAEFPYSDDELRDYVKWCARYDVFVIMDWKQTRSQIDIYADCPIFWGHFVTDEPAPSRYAAIAEDVKEYLEQTAEYNWKPYVNFEGIRFVPEQGIEFDTESGFGADDILELWKENFSDILPIFSQDLYIIQGKYRTYSVLTAFETISNTAKEYGKEYWHYIEAYNLVNRNFNTSKLFRWESYMAMCFGADCIQYFEYGDASPNYSAEGDWSYGSLINYDFTKNQAWYDAQRANEEILKIAEMLRNYEHVGECLYGGPVFGELFTDLKDPIDYSYVIEGYKDEVYKHPYLFGCYDEKDGDGHMFLITNMLELDDVDYDESWNMPVKFKIKGENVTFYRNGEAFDVQKDADGYYSLEIPIGGCIAVKVD